MFNKLRRRLQKSARIYYVEINDVKIDEDVSHILINLEKEIKQFKSRIEDMSIHDKNEELDKFYELMIGLKQQIEKLKADVRVITQIESGNKEYVTIKDDSFLRDKRVQLERLTSEIDELLQISEQKPTKNDFEFEFLPKIMQQLNSMLQVTKRIVDDDTHLRLIYKQYYHI